LREHREILVDIRQPIGVFQFGFFSGLRLFLALEEFLSRLPHAPK
jgi:hypothetical protein